MSQAIRPMRDKWPSTITDRERYNRQMHYESVDRCFNMEFGYWDENFGQWSIFAENHVTNNEEAALFFNFDKIELFEYAWMLPLFEEQIVEETDSTKTIINADGLLAEVPKDGHDTIPHFIKSTIVTPNDWKRCKESRFQRDDPLRAIDVEALKKKHPEDRDYPLGISCGSMIGKVRDLLTFEGLAFAIYDYPAMVEEMVEMSCLLVEDVLDQVLEEIDFDFAWGWEDICFKTGPIVSIDFFKNIVVPRYKRINTKLKAHGIDIWWSDCDGDVRPILPLMMESGLNCLFPLEVNACGRPNELLDTYGKDLRIMGGFDKMALGAGRTEIREYMESLIPYVERGGYIPFCDHRCPPNVKEEDYLYYLDLKEQMLGQV